MTEGVTVLHLSNREREGRDEESAFIYSGEKERENERENQRKRRGESGRDLCDSSRNSHFSAQLKHIKSGQNPGPCFAGRGNGRARR